MTEDKVLQPSEEKERIVGHQARLTGAVVIATVIVLMSASLAFITVPPQPIALLLGIRVAVVIYWVARTTEATRSPRAVLTRSVLLRARIVDPNIGSIERNAAQVRIRSHPTRVVMRKPGTLECDTPQPWSARCVTFDRSPGPLRMGSNAPRIVR
ncbi:MAG: hypothetical protein V3U33_04185 [candidate division NC10 bacterium]